MQVTTLTDNKQNDCYKYMHLFNTIDSTFLKSVLLIKQNVCRQSTANTGVTQSTWSSLSAFALQLTMGILSESRGHPISTSLIKQNVR